MKPRTGLAMGVLLMGALVWALVWPDRAAAQLRPGRFATLIVTRLAEITRLALGTTTASGLTVQNTTAAAAGAQQYSPGFSQIGQGWKTDATAASQPVEVRWELRPVQGAANPTYNYVLLGRINNGSWSDLVTIGSNTLFSRGAASADNIGPNGMQVQAGNYYTWQNRSVIKSPADGTLSATNAAETVGLRLQYLAAPAIASGFGTSPAITAGSTDSAGEVNVGTGGTATSGVINFGATWSSDPVSCVCQDVTTDGKFCKAQVNSGTRTTLTLSTSAAWSASDKLQWLCIGAK